MNIVLLGMPLSGKTTIGKVISEILSIKHIDLDCEIENSYGDNIYNLFLSFGEKEFRRIECECLKEVSSDNAHVLSLGGGTANALNFRTIQSYSNRVWLKCSLDEIIKRYNHNERSEKKRPLLYNTNNLIKKLNQLYTSRETFFNDLANIKVDTSFSKNNEVAKQVIIKINEPN